MKIASKSIDSTRIGETRYYSMCFTRVDSLSASSRGGLGGNRDDTRKREGTMGDASGGCKKALAQRAYAHYTATLSLYHIQLKKFRGLVKNGAQEHDEFPHLLREMQEAFRKAVRLL